MSNIALLLQLMLNISLQSNLFLRNIAYANTNFAECNKIERLNITERSTVKTLNASFIVFVCVCWN